MYVCKNICKSPAFHCFPGLKMFTGKSFRLEDIIWVQKPKTKTVCHWFMFNVNVSVDVYRDVNVHVSCQR